MRPAARVTIAQAQGDRSYQEDRAVHGRHASGGVLVLADGMGGHRNGAEAAEAAVRAVLHALSGRSIPTTQSADVALRDAVSAACAAVEVEAPGGGCTLIVAVVLDETVEVIHVGDSQVWHDGVLVTEAHHVGIYLTSCIPRPERIDRHTLPRRGRIVVASDGVEDPASGDAQAVVDAQLALGRERQDNATAIVLDLADVVEASAGRGAS